LSYEPRASNELVTDRAKLGARRSQLDVISRTRLNVHPG